MVDSRGNGLLKALEAALAARDAAALDEVLEELHPTEVAAWFDEAGEPARQGLLELASDERLGDVF
jgi:Mg/Co/Ni transporter MgtE